MKKIILIQYGELTTKKENRKVFINLLFNNIKDKLKNYSINIIKNRVRMFIECQEKDLEEITNILKHIFGIHGIVICYQVNTNTKDIEDAILNIIKQLDFKTFKVETKRSDKNFPIPSLEFNKNIGSLVLKNKKDISVDVHHPEYLLKIEIRNDYTYIYSKEIKGMGGYPLGVAGKGLVMLSGGIDSPVAAYLAMKRGIKIECMYFASPPHTSIQAENKVKKLVKILNQYQPNIKLHIINFTDIQENIYKNCDPSYMITIMRRMMYRIGEKIAKKNKCPVIVNGESVGQVASQTLPSISVINNVTNYPIIRPVVCLDKLEIIEISKKINTYETSILPYEDCCTIFLPKHPIINPKLDYTIKEENRISYQELIDNIQEEVITINDDYQL